MGRKKEADGTTVNSYRDLLVWQKSMDLAVECYELTKAFPASEVYGLTSQIRRSAGSIAANISEGQGRETTGTFIQHLRIAQGSLKELETHLVLAMRVGLMDDASANRTAAKCEEIGKMLRALIRRLQEK